MSERTMTLTEAGKSFAAVVARVQEAAGDYALWSLLEKRAANPWREIALAP